MFALVVLGKLQSFLIQAIMPSYQTFRFFKLIGWTSSTWNNAWNFELGEFYQIHTLQRYCHHFLVKLGTFKEYHCSFLVCGALIFMRLIPWVILYYCNKQLRNSFFFALLQRIFALNNLYVA